jgi:arylsulfatase
MDPDPLGSQWNGFSGPWRGGIGTSLESSNRAPCIIRWPGKVPTGKVSNELVHEVDTFTTLLLAAGAKVPADRQIDGMDMRDFLLGDAEQSGRDTVLCLQGNRLQAVKWRQWRAHLFQQDDSFSTWSPYNVPHIHNLEWDPREEHEGDLPARLGVAPHGRCGRGVSEVTCARSPDQNGDTRSVSSTQTR